MTTQAMNRLLSLSQALSETGEQMREASARFARIAGRKENGTAPQAVIARQLFQTPRDLAARVVELADIQPDMSILEPSAGLGRLLDALPAHCRDVQAVDISADCCRALESREGVAIHHGDFLSTQPAMLGLFDRVVMNPPFTMRSDIKHVMHALKFLKPGGLLVSIVMDTQHRRNAFNGWEWHDIPAGTFKESNTGVNTAIVVYRKDYPPSNPIHTHTMKRPNITPGPWSLTGPLNNQNGEFIWCPQTQASDIAIVSNYYDTKKPQSEHAANAQAIAAVPSMMDALESVFCHLEQQEADGRLGHSSAYLMVKDALLKAGYTL